MLRKVESNINTALMKFPAIKKIIKRVYQVSMYAISPKIKSEGDIIRITPQDDYEYFFGYYDKSPWDASERYMLCIRVKDTTISVAPKEPADIILIDTHNNNSYEVIAKTNTWNVQQGCMLQWLGPDYSEQIIFNDFRDEKYCSIVLNLKTREEKVIGMPVYSVSNDGKFALTLDFSRLHRLRKGYGYSNLEETTADEKLPDKPCIWHINLETNETKSVLKYSDFANFETRPEMNGAEHKVNHIMLNPSGDRFMVLHRWFNGTQKYTRLVTAKTDGSDLFNLSDDNMTSHCNWKSDAEILAYARKKETGNGYYLMKDKTKEYTLIWPELMSDGHPSYSPDGSMVVTDTYPNRSRVAYIYIINKNDVKILAKVFAPFRYDNDLRCDLHPRWSRDGKQICFDSVFEGHRGLYVVKLTDTLLDGLSKDKSTEQFDMNQVRFVMPLHGFYNQLIQEEGYEISNPYIGNSTIPRIFREIHFRLNLPFKSVWFNKENIVDKRAIIVFDPLIVPDYMKWLRYKNQNSRIVLFYINAVNAKNNPKQFSDDWCEKWAGDRNDCKKYGMNLYDYIAYFHHCNVEKTTPEFDIFFVGKDKGRLDKLLELQNTFNDLGLKTYFHIVAERKWQAKLNKHYKSFMPYSQVLNTLERSKTSLYLVEGAQTGVTMRVIESLLFEVKLITDNQELMNYDFYNPNNIFILGVDDIKTLPEFINSPYEQVNSKMFKHVYFEDMIQSIVEDSKGGFE